MSVHKIVKRKNPFVQIDASAIEHSGLSWKAKGILVYLLSKPNGWEVYQSDIVKHANDGKTSVAAGLQELREAGFIVRRRKRMENGQLMGWESHVYEKPKKRKLTESGFSAVGRAYVGKAAPSNIERSNKENRRGQVRESDVSKNRLNGNGTSSNSRNGKKQNPPVKEELDVPVSRRDAILAEMLMQFLRSRRGAQSAVAGAGTVKKKQWIREMRSLINDVDGDSDRVLNVMEFYCSRPHDAYTPKVYHASQFRSKFLQIEDWIQREKGAKNEDVDFTPGKRRSKCVGEEEDDGGPIGEEEEFAEY